MDKDAHRSEAAHLIVANGEMAERIRSFDWTRTPLGAIDTWPQSLRSAVAALLVSKAQIVFVWGDDLTTFYNDAYRPVFGGKHPAALGMPVREAWSEIWLSGLKDLFDGVLTTGEAFWAQDRPFFIERHGYLEETYFDVSYDPVRDESGRVRGVYCIVTETTRRVVGERRLAMLRDLGRITQEAGGVAGVYRAAAEVLHGNETDLPFALLYGVAPAGGPARLMASSGIEAHSIGAPAEMGGHGTPAWPLVEEMTILEGRALEPFGPLRAGPWPDPIRQVALVPLALGGQATQGWLVVGINPRRPFDDEFRDFLRVAATNIAGALATVRRAEEERQRAETLAELDRAKTAFFSNVSHEFRTPLTLLLGPLEDALRAADVPEPQRETLAVAHRNGLRLLRLVNTLLDFSRIEAGRADAVYERVDIASFTADLASVFRSAFERAGLSLAVSCERPRAEVLVDRSMWEKIVLNLLSNAFKFTLQGGVTISLVERGAFIELEISDTGIGIPAHELPHVFERFHRVRGTEGRTHEGTGIGLALVTELVKLHGGEVAARSELAKGTCFQVRIPTGSAHLPQERIGAARERVSTALGAAPFVEEALRWLPDAEAPAEGARPVDVPVTTSKARVLIADDNADMRSYLARLLEPYWRIEAVEDGEAALRAIQRERPDLVLSDVMMPRLDGISLTRAIRATPELQDIPIVLLSARAAEESRIEGVAAQADDYLTKPFSARELVARVNLHLGLAQIRRETVRERIHAEDAIRHRSEQFETLVNRAPLGIYLVDADLRIAEVNPVAQPLFGDLPDLVGKDFVEVVHGRWEKPHAEEIVRIFRHTLETGESYVTPEHAEHRVDRDETRYYEWRLDRIKLPDGRFGLVCYFRDISQQVEARQRLIRAQADAELANRAKDGFLAVLSHELRSPLNAMLAWVQILKSAAEAGGLVSRAAETLERNVWVQAQVIDDLLDISRITSGKLVLERTRVDVAAVVAGVVESMRPLAAGKRIDLGLSMTQDALEVDGDAARLQQAVGNLLHNAIKFTPEGGRVKLDLRGGAGRAELVVEDTGPGIDAELLPRIFDKFVQSESGTTRRHGGLGLGLAIVKHLVGLHGGNVEAESEGLGCGARFRIRLPLALPLPRQAEAVSAEAPPPLPEGMEALDVLLVEDDADSREALAIVIEQTGAQVRQAGSVRQALEAYDARPPDILVSDIGIPGEDGYSLIRRIREREEGGGRRTLAIAMTGFATRHDHETALRAGFDEHVVKPVEPEALLDRMRILAASREGGAEALRRP